MEKKNYDIGPTVIYYINNPLKIINNKLLNLPKPLSFSHNIEVSNSYFSGYNEIDICQKVRKTIHIDENYNFCEINENKGLINNNKISLLGGYAHVLK